MKGRRTLAVVAFSCLSIGSLMFAPVAGAQELLPNLRALPAGDISIVPNASTGNLEIRFSATSWNSGNGPMEIVAGETGSAGQNVYQRVYTSTGTFNDYLAGTFIWHPEHAHFHFQQYAVYTLTPINAPGKSKRDAYKTSFCIMDTGKFDGRLPGAPKREVYRTCFDIRQGMSVGWGDTYGAGVAGQAIDLTGYDDGLYDLTVEFDPDNRILETNDNDNKACVRLQLGIAARTVQKAGSCGPPPAPAVTVSSISPASSFVGDIIDAVITGTNFATGMAVGFEGGSGPAPVPSNVTVLSSTTISLTISIKQSGKPGDPVWDVRVGSAVLPNAFTVQR